MGRDNIKLAILFKQKGKPRSSLKGGISFTLAVAFPFLVSLNDKTSQILLILKQIYFFNFQQSQLELVRKHASIPKLTLSVMFGPNQGLELIPIELRL